MPSIFTTPRVQPGVYETELNRKFGPAWVTWEPETLWSEIRRVEMVYPTTAIANKINALKVMLAKPELFFQDATVFENMIMAVCDLNVDPAAFQLASPEEIIFGIESWIPIAINHKTLELFGQEIIAYVRVVCQNAGLLVYPETLKFAQPEYGEPLKHFAKLIVPLGTPPTDESDLVGVQGFKLYQVEQCVKAMHGPLEVT